MTAVAVSDHPLADWFEGDWEAIDDYLMERFQHAWDDDEKFFGEEDHPLFDAQSDDRVYPRPLFEVFENESFWRDPETQEVFIFEFDACYPCEIAEFMGTEVNAHITAYKVDGFYFNDGTSMSIHAGHSVRRFG